MIEEILKAVEELDRLNNEIIAITKKQSDATTRKCAEIWRDYEERDKKNKAKLNSLIDELIATI
jgi:hypothetical protein